MWDYPHFDKAFFRLFSGSSCRFFWGGRNRTGHRNYLFLTVFSRELTAALVSQELGKDRTSGVATGGAAWSHKVPCKHHHPTSHWRHSGQWKQHTGSWYNMHSAGILERLDWAINHGLWPTDVGHHTQSWEWRRMRWEVPTYFLPAPIELLQIQVDPVGQCGLIPRRTPETKTPLWDSEGTHWHSCIGLGS